MKLVASFHWLMIWVCQSRPIRTVPAKQLNMPGRVHSLMQDANHIDSEI